MVTEHATSSTKPMERPRRRATPGWLIGIMASSCRTSNRRHAARRASRGRYALMLRSTETLPHSARRVVGHRPANASELFLVDQADRDVIPSSTRGNTCRTPEGRRRCPCVPEPSRLAGRAHGRPRRPGTFVRDSSLWVEPQRCDKCSAESIRANPYKFSSDKDECAEQR
jgi:hypothetical protein